MADARLARAGSSRGRSGSDWEKAAAGASGWFSDLGFSNGGLLDGATRESGFSGLDTLMSISPARPIATRNYPELSRHLAVSGDTMVTGSSRPSTSSLAVRRCSRRPHAPQPESRVRGKLADRELELTYPRPNLQRRPPLVR